MAKAKKLPNGKWRLRVYDASNPISHYKCFTADSQKDVEYMANQYLFSKKEIRDPSFRTLGIAMDEFIDNRNNVLSPTTVALYRVIARTAFTDIRDTRITALNQTLIQKSVNAYARGRAYKTVSNAVAFLSIVLKEYHPDLRYKVHMPQKTKTPVEIPTKEDVDALLDKSKNTAVYLPILIATQLGLRRGEICALTWDDIDLEKRTIRIDESMAEDEFGILVRKKPKTAQSERTLQLTQDVIDALPEKGSKIITIAPKTITKHFAIIAKQLGLKCTFHSLRHYYASVMLQLGVPDKYAMERMGHSTNNMLKRVYQHTFESEHEIIDSKLQSYFNDKK